MVRETAEKALLRLARQSAASWQALRGDAFLGATTVETANTLYRFQDALVAGRAPKRAAHEALRWQLPRSMSGMELIGFFAYEGGLWRLSPRWREGSLAVLGKLGSTNDGTFTLTSPVLACTITRGVAMPRAALAKPERSDVFFRRPAYRPPSVPAVRRPAPPSMTRIQPAPELDAPLQDS